MTGRHIAHRFEHGFDPTRELFVPCRKHLFDDLSLQVILRPAEITRDNGEFSHLSKPS